MDNEEEFCEAMWCYVDPACEASDTQASSTIEGNAYSFVTCGDTGDFPDGDLENVPADEAEGAEDEAEEEVDPCDPAPTDAAWIAFCNVLAGADAEGADEAATDAEGEEEADACACLSENGLDIVDGMSAANY